MNYVNDKVVVITGAGSGFGKLASEKLADMRAKIILADINAEVVKAATNGIKANNGTAEFIVADVSIKEQVDKMAEFAVKTFGRIDVLVNNAGIMPNSLFSSKNNAAWDKCIDINLKGVIYGITAVIDTMNAQGEGQVINISSLYGLNTHAAVGIYSATKAGVKMISNALRAETRGKIKVSTIYPSAAVSNLGTTVLDQDATLKGLWGHLLPEFMNTMSINSEAVINPEKNSMKTPNTYCDED